MPESHEIQNCTNTVIQIKLFPEGTSLEIQWLRPPSSAGGTGSIPGKEAKIPHASGPKHQNIKQKQYCNKFNEDLKKKKKKKLFTEDLLSAQHSWGFPGMAHHMLITNPSDKP